MTHYIKPLLRNRSRGTVLIIVIVLLLFVSLLSLFAMSVGVFEQRTSANDARAKMVKAAADAAIAYGAEYLNANRQLLDPANFAANWEVCDASDDFPCGAIAPVRRGTTYRYVGGGGSGTLDNRSLPIAEVIPDDARVTDIGGFDVDYRVGAVLCQISFEQDPVTGEALCVIPGDPNASPTSALTLVAKAEIPGEGASKTVVQGIGLAPIVNVSPEVPPIVASGGINVSGGFQVATNPNSGGIGVPVSVWTRQEVDPNGTPNTCYLEDFLRNPGGGNATATDPETGGSITNIGYLADIPVCLTCSCDNSISFGGTGSVAAKHGMDILHISDDPWDPNSDANRYVERDEFPCDLFEYVFGIPGWEDVNQGASSADPEYNFCESALPRVAVGGDASFPSARPDTAFLIENAQLRIGDGDNDAAECSSLGPDSVGFIWIHGNCGSNTLNGKQIGSPTNPVIMVWDGSLSLQSQTVIFGLLFVREPDASNSLSAATGGTANLDARGGTTFYGAVIVQGQMQSNGNAAIVFHEDILKNLVNNPNNRSFSSVPGSWTDKAVSY